MHTIFIIEKYTGCEPRFGESLNRFSLLKTYEKFSGEVTPCTYSCVHYDQYFLDHRKTADYHLIERCIEEKPDMVFYTWINTPRNPSFDVMAIIKKMGIPIVALWWDSWHPISKELADHMLPFTTFNIFPDDWTEIGGSNRLGKFFNILTPQDEEIFYGDPDCERDIKVLHSGNPDKEDRNKVLDYLKQKGINITTTSGGFSTSFTVDDVASMMRRAKMVINITQHYAIKGRTLEAMLCGACLLEPKWTHAQYAFRKDIDYISYEKLDELAYKIKYYLDNDKERLKIARSGHKYALENYSSNTFWSKVMEKLSASRLIAH